MFLFCCGTLSLQILVSSFSRKCQCEHAMVMCSVAVQDGDLTGGSSVAMAEMCVMGIHDIGHF